MFIDAEICSLLNLEPNATCGAVRVSFVSPLAISAGGLPAPFACKGGVCATCQPLAPVMRRKAS